MAIHPADRRALAGMARFAPLGADGPAVVLDTAASSRCSGGTVRPVRARPCSSSGEPIDCCEFCDATDCRTPTCYGCLQAALGQAVPQPHAHGG